MEETTAETEPETMHEEETETEASTSPEETTMETEEPTEDPGNGPDTEPPEEEEPQEAESSDSGYEEAGGTDTSKKIYDENGGEQDIPVNVYGVAAVGSTAMAVLMLGGPDALAATNEDLLENHMASSAFSSLDAEYLWKGDGSSGITDENIEKLLDMGNRKPEVMLYTSEDYSITEKQAEELNNIKQAMLLCFTEDSVMKIGRAHV